MDMSLNVLAENVSRLPARDQGFAQSLLSNSKRYMLSDNQMKWVRILADRACGKEAPKETAQIDNVAGVVALLDRGKSRIKWPALLISVADMELRLSIAGASASAPGSINVCSTEGGYGTRIWYGRILRDGRFEPSRKIANETTSAVIQALRALAADPARIAAEFGRKLGRCCFCNLPLKQGRSTDVGYGQTCARHYNLPW